MTGINSFSGTHAAALAAAAPVDGATSPSGEAGARSLAGTAIGEIGQRVLAWVGQSARGLDTASTAWAGTSGVAAGFRPDAAVLARRGDVYGLRDLAASITGSAGGTPTQEGELRRSLEGFTRQAVVQIAGLSGANADRQLGGMRAALGTALDTQAGGGVDGVIGRLDAATRALAHANGA